MTNPKETERLNAFGRHVRNLIRDAGFPSRNQFCMAAGINSMSLYRWETDPEEKLPRTKYLRQMADALGVRIEELLRYENGEDHEREEPEPAYPAFKEWYEHMAPTDLTNQEYAQLASTMFSGGEPDPRDYNTLLFAIRAPKHAAAQRDEESKTKRRVIADKMRKTGAKPIKKRSRKDT